MRYKSRHTDVEAMQWDAIPGLRDGLTAEDVVAWVNANGGEARYESQNKTGLFHSRIAVRTINGWAYAAPGHYIVMGDALFNAAYTDETLRPVRLIRDFYPCDPETFEQRWEEA